MRLNYFFPRGGALHVIDQRNEFDVAYEGSHDNIFEKVIWICMPVGSSAEPRVEKKKPQRAEASRPNVDFRVRREEFENLPVISVILRRIRGSFRR